MPARYETADEQPPTSHFSDILRNVPLAELLHIPNQRVVSIEHPCIIRNLENGFKSMGGEPRMKHILEHHVGDSLQNPAKPKPEPELGVSLRPEDPLATKLTSVGLDTRNVLIKVTLPKRTGRKRKRGSNGPFEELGVSEPVASITAPDLLRRLRDNASKYVIEPVSMVHETHRFRGLPDFQTRAGDVPIFQELTEHALQPSWKKLKAFTVDATPGAPIVPSFPGPPTFAASAQPYRYEYQQAAGVRFSRDEAGNIKSTNTQAPARKLMKAVPPDCADVPVGPPAQLKVHNPFGTFLPRIIDELRQLLEKRPLVTRRVAMSSITPCSDTLFREATQWVGYNFSAGPFRDTLIKYGVDPRKDPKYRIYQTLMFQLDKRPSRSATEKGEKWSRGFRLGQDSTLPIRDSHIFDGEHIFADGKTWQVCDISDPVIKRIFDTTDLAAVCDVYSYGWFHPDTMCRARIIMRSKMERCISEKPIPHHIYEVIAFLPELLDDFTYEKALGIFGDLVDAKEAATLASDVRNVAKAGHKQFLMLRDVRAERAGDGEPDQGTLAEDEPIQGDLDDALEEEEQQAV